MSIYGDRPRTSLPAKIKIARFSEPAIVGSVSPSRRKIIAAVKRHSAPNLNTKSHRQTSRVDKHRDNARKPTTPKRSSGDILAGLLNEHVDKVRQDATVQLEDHEKTLNVSIDEMIAKFLGQLKLFQAAENPLLGSINSESLRINVKSAHTGEYDRQIVRLTDRMNDFNVGVKEKEDIITRLSNEWEEVQAEILCLAIEILGGESIIFEPEHHRLSDAMAKPMRAAEKQHQTTEQRYQKLFSSLDDAERSVKELTQNTKRGAEKQRRAMISDQSRQFRAATAALQGLTSRMPWTEDDSAGPSCG